jgi:hypothetical protein
VLIRRLVPPAAAVALVVIAAACQEPEPLSLESETQSYRVQLDLDGASLGRRTATIEVTDATRRPVAAEQVVLSAVMDEMDMSGPTVIARRVGDGRYEAEGEVFTMLGDWTVTVRVEGPGSQPAEQAQFTVEAVP